MNSPMVFTIPQVERLTKLSRRTIMRWQRLGLFFPKYPRPLPIDGPYHRIYTFRDVVALRALVDLRRRFRVALPELRRVGLYLRKHRRSPWSTMRFWIVDGQVVFRDPMSNLLLSGKDLSQVAIEQIVLEQVAANVNADAETLGDRDPETRGQIAQQRNVMSNRPVVAGTRIPTSVIWEFHEAGYTTGHIIEEYPDLTREDIEAAIAHELPKHRDAA